MFPILLAIASGKERLVISCGVSYDGCFCAVCFKGFDCMGLLDGVMFV